MNKKLKNSLRRYTDILCYVGMAMSIVALIWAAFVSISGGTQNPEPAYPVQDTETDVQLVPIEDDVPIEIRMMSANKRQRSESKPVVEAPESGPPYLESDVEMIAKLMFMECGSVPSNTEKACVVWAVLNRADAWDMSIQEIIRSANQFAYSEQAPVTEELYALATDVLNRWSAEKNGVPEVGRVLPKEYMWFWGDGMHNYFRNAYSGVFTVWDYSLQSPYES